MTSLSDLFKEKMVFDERAYIGVIHEWKAFWMNQNQNSIEDRDNYRRRAFGIDANMKYDLARRLIQHSRQAKINEAVGEIIAALDEFIEYYMVKESQSNESRALLAARDNFRKVLEGAE